MGTLFSNEIVSFLNKIFKDKVDDKIEFETDATWNDVLAIYEKQLNDSIFQEEKPYKDIVGYKHLNCSDLWERVTREDNFKKACLIELVLEFRRYRHIYHSPKMGSGIYLKRDEEEFKTRKINGKVVEKADEEVEMAFDDYLNYLDACVNIFEDYTGETDEDIFPQKRCSVVKGDEEHILLSGKGKDVEKRVERLKEITVKSGSYLPIDVLNLIKIPRVGSEQENPQFGYLAENVYTRLSAAILEDDDVYGYFFISKLSGEGDKRANGYRNKTVQDARKVYGKFCEFLLEGKQSYIEANIWAEELCGFSLERKLFFALSGLFDVFSCNSRNIRVDCEGEKYSLDTDTQDFFLLLESIVENLIQVHSQYLRIVLVDEIAAECNRIGSKVHVRNKKHKERVIEFLCEIALFLISLVYGNDNINERFINRLRLTCYLVYKVKPNLFMEADSVEKEIELLVEKIEDMIEQNLDWGISEEEWKHICVETADRKKGKVLYDKLARGIMRYNFEHNCEKTYLARRRKELFTDEIWEKAFKNGEEDVIAQYYIEEKLFGFKKFVKIVEEGKPIEVLLSGLYYINNTEQPGMISYTEFLKSDAILINDSENKDFDLNKS